MNAEIIAQLIPAIAIVMTFGLPIGIVFVVKHFKYKHRELEAELEVRRMLGDGDRAVLEKRIERLELLVMGPNAPAPVAEPGSRFTQPQSLPPVRDPSLYSGPPTDMSTSPGTPKALRDKS